MEDKNDGKKPWSQVLTDSVNCYPVENRKADARDHMANERTFLAWLRTALSAVGLGIAVAKLGATVSNAYETGVLLIAFGLFYIVYGTFHYYHCMVLLQRGLFPISKIGVFLVFLTSFVGIVIIITLL
eukprot:TRINITY_DN3134_c0_g1_i1.p1 TRINITY_DN3134_c0_g1~~TRINITY_DN3134_c0_g1_i1.p1  ORF type:complete len:136 (+),score=35.09 TRINITY_DN3134_c0_g1_i1:26-409(+)